MKTDELDYRISAHEAADFRVEMAKHFDHWNDRHAYSWEWEACPYGSTQCLASHRGQIIGHYGFIAMHFLLAGKRVLGAKIEGSYVRREYEGRRVRNTFPDRRGVTIFQSLVSFAITEAMKRYEFIFGFPNAAATRSQAQAGCELWNMPVLAYSLVPYPRLRRISGLLGRLSPAAARTFVLLRGRVTHRPPATIDAEVVATISDINAASGLNTIDYDLPYLCWRTLSNPHGQGFVCIDREMSAARGFLIGSVKVSANGLRIMTINDLKTGPNAIACEDVVLSRLVRSAIRQYRPDEVYTWFNVNRFESMRDHALRSLGFRVERRTYPVLFRSSQLVPAHEQFDINPMWTEGV